ncbi:MAG: FAD-dependent oxidoreductase [Clostridiales bacterium]|nr:FAD-dependent oxidoreductase [Clostridiales bacterium]
MEDFPLWEQGIRPEFPQLKGAVQADVAIVGGGLTGATCAAMLAAAGAKVVLLEARRLGRGASWNCTGKVTSQLVGIYQTIAEKAGMDAAGAYARLMREAVTGVRELCARLNVPTQEQSVYVFAETIDDLPALNKLHRLESRLGLPVTEATDAGGCPFPVELSLVMHKQLLLAPLPYLLSLVASAEKNGGVIYEHSPVRAVEGRRVLTENGAVKAETILLATGSPAGCTSLPRLAMLQQRTCQTVVLEGGPPLLASHLSVQPDELTLRPTHTGALLAWDLGRTGTREHPGRQLILQRTLRALLPDMRVIESYIRQDVWSGDGLPLIGPVKPKHSHILMATGYSGWGVCNSYLAAKILTAQLSGRPLADAGLFRPDRASPKLMEGMRIAGAYLGGAGRIGAPTCTHMLGKLRFDPESQRWECPCHGSTFTALGETLDGPAIHDAQVSARQR